MRQGRLVSVLGLAALGAACSRAPAPPLQAAPPAPTSRPPASEEIDEGDLRLVLDVERALRERGIEADRLRRSRALRLTAADLSADREVQAQVAGAARDQGEDAERYVRARQRLDQVLLARQLRGQSEATQRFRAAHAESLKRTRELAASDGERARLDGILVEVEAGQAREREAVEASRAFASEAELRLVEAHAAELGLKPLLGPPLSPSPTPDDAVGGARPADAEPAAGVPPDTASAVTPPGGGSGQ